MLVREYWPMFMERGHEYREQLVSTKEAALEIPWIKNEGDVRLEGSVVKKGKFVVALILTEDGKAYAP